MTQKIHVDCPPDAGGPVVLIVGTLDTKSDEIRFVRCELEKLGCQVAVVDCGVLGTPSIDATVTRAEIARAGGGDLDTLRRERRRNVAIPIMVRGVEVEVRRRFDDGKVLGIMGIGGGTNAAFAAAAFRALPFGVPKLLVSTVACGNTRPFVGVKDVVLIHSVVDVLGLNGFLRDILVRASNVMAAMVRDDRPMPAQGNDAPCVAITAFGCTTPAANRAWETFTARRFETLAFHARGIGGEAMETFVREGRIQAVLDLTTTEIADEIVGGICSAGPNRLLAAGEAGIPQVVLPGAIDVVNFGPPETVPIRFAERNLFAHTPHATLMRTTAEENVRIAAFMADKLNRATGPTGVVLPLRGFSAYDADDGVFFDPLADAAFHDTLSAKLRPDIPVERIDANINDAQCVDAATAMLLRMITDSSQETKQNDEHKIRA